LSQSNVREGESVTVNKITSIWRSHDFSHIDILVPFKGIELDFEVLAGIESKGAFTSEGGQLERLCLDFDIFGVARSF
jgi:hypothetical protein